MAVRRVTIKKCEYRQLNKVNLRTNFSFLFFFPKGFYEAMKQKIQSPCYILKYFGVVCSFPIENSYSFMPYV